MGETVAADFGGAGENIGDGPTGGVERTRAGWIFAARAEALPPAAGPPPTPD